MSSKLPDKKTVIPVSDIDHYQQLVDTAPVMIWEAGTDTLCNFFNKPWLDFTGRTMEQSLGNGWADDVHADDLERCLKTYLDAFANREKFSMEYRLRRHDEKYRWILDNGVPRYGQDGDFFGYIGSCIDISEVKEEETRYFNLSDFVENSHISLHWVGPDGIILWANRYEMESLGYSRDEYIGRHIAEFHADQEVIKDILERLGRGEILHNYEAALRCKDGSLKDVLISSSTLFKDDNFIHTRCVTTDITERKRVEQALRQSDERFELSIKGSSDGFWDWDIRSSYVWWSPRFYELLGYEDNQIEVTYQTFLDALHPEDRDRTHKAVVAHLEQHIPYDIEYRLQTTTGEYRWCYARGQALWNEDGEPTRMSGSIQDITERKHIEEALRESEERFELATLGSSDGLWVWNIDAGKDWWSPRYYELLGYEDREIESSYAAFINLLHPDDKQRVTDATDSHLNSSSPYDIEYRLQTKSGEYRWFHARGKTNRDEAGAAMHMAGSIQNITERKTAEAGQKELERKLFHSQKMEAVGQLTGGIAHDFNNILAGMLGYINMALKHSINIKETKQTAYLKEIQYGGERAKNLVEQMLMYARAIPEQAGDHSLKPLVEKALKMLRPTLPSSIDINMHLATAVSCIRVDPTQFEQVIMNLCINARDAIKDVGSIDVDLYSTNINGDECASCHEEIAGDYVVLSVQDSGTGIPDEIRELIFDPYFTTKSVGHGTGMGLSMAHGIIHTSGGHILMDSVAGQGTTFQLLFPDTGSCLEKSEQQIEESGIEPVTRVKRGVIMVVDDEPSIAAYLGELLESHGHNTIVLTSSETALTTFREAPDSVDLIIMDQTMPGITGFELAKKMLLLRPDLPIILNTGYSEQVDDRIAQQAGIKGYLKKPFAENILMDKIEELL